MPDFQQTSDDVCSGTEVVDDFIEAIAVLEQDRNTEPLAYFDPTAIPRQVDSISSSR